MRGEKSTTIDKVYQQRYNPRTQSLNLLKCNAGDKSMQYILQTQDPIKALFLTCNQLTAIGVLLLTKRKWQNLEFLYLGNNMLGPKGAKMLSRGDWTDVQRLNLNGNGLGSSGMGHLAKGKWPNVNNLELCNNSIGDEGAILLSQGDWPWVANLILTRNKVGLQGALKIAREWPNLKALDLEENEPTKRLNDKIKNAVGKNKQIVIVYLSS